jgi:hypothetical protein
MKLCKNKLHDVDLVGYHVKYDGRRKCRECYRACCRREKLTSAGRARDRRCRIKHRIKRNAFTMEWRKRNKARVKENNARYYASIVEAGGVANAFWQRQARNSL